MDKECLAAQASGDLEALYIAILSLTERLLRKEMKSKGLYFPADKVKELTHDATTLFMEYYYLRHKRIIIYFIPMVQRFIKTVLYKPGSNRSWDKTVELTEHPYTPPQQKEDIKDYFLDIYTEHPRSKWIIYYLWSSKYYGRAIRKIAKITGKAWIYDRAVKLRKLWEVLHWTKSF